MLGHKPMTEAPDVFCHMHTFEQTLQDSHSYVCKEEVVDLSAVRPWSWEC